MDTSYGMTSYGTLFTIGISSCLIISTKMNIKKNPVYGKESEADVWLISRLITAFPIITSPTKQAAVKWTVKRNGGQRVFWTELLDGIMYGSDGTWL